MGRKALPDQVKKLRGTDQPARMKGTMEIPSIVKLPKPPEWMNQYSKTIYKETGNSLIALKILNPINFNLFVAYAQQLGTHFEAEAQMVDERIHNMGNASGNYTIPKALHKISKDSLEKAVMLASQFGITPATEGKIRRTNDSKDEFDNFLG